jgi:hypothetical protein
MGPAAGSAPDGGAPRGRRRGAADHPGVRGPGRRGAHPLLVLERELEAARRRGRRAHGPLRRILRQGDGVAARGEHPRADDRPPPRPARGGAGRPRCARGTHPRRAQGPTLCLAINYGSRTEIVDAARSLARAAAAGEIDPDAIGERDIADRLYAPDLPDPDLFIRTGGSHRLSNFLLWQLSYAELVVTDTLWPDSTQTGWRPSIAEFSRRERRFGGLTSTRGVAPTHETR